jgi:aconitase B
MDVAWCCRIHDAERPAVGWDRGFAGPEDQATIAEICALLDASSEEQGKKALEPITVLTIALTVAATNVASGFLQKIGADAWDAVKPTLKSLFARRRLAALGSYMIPLQVSWGVRLA